MPRHLLIQAGLFLLLSSPMMGQTTKAIESMTTAAKNDGERARMILSLARQATDPNRRLILLEQAADYGTRRPMTTAGRGAADDALNQLASLDAARAIEHTQRRLELCRSWAVSASTPEDKQAAARRQLGAMMALARMLEARGGYDEASALYRQAIGITDSFNLLSVKEVVDADLLRARAMSDAVKAVEALRAKAKDNPDANTRGAIVTLLAGHLDDPNAAASYASADLAEPYRSCCPLLGALDKLSASDCMKLATFYQKGLAPHVPVPLRPRLEERQLALYRQVLASEAPDDLSAQARVALEALEDARAQRVMKPRPDVVQLSKRLAALPEAKRLDGLKAAMRQSNGNIDVEIQSVSKALDMLRIDDDNGGLVTLEPLYGWPLTSITLSSCLSLQTLDGLQGSRKLTGMVVRYCPSLGTLVHLKGVPLETLELITATNLSSLEGLKGAPLKSVIIAGARQLADISPLAGARLWRLELDGCPAITDLTALKSQPLERLSLVDAAGLRSLSPLKGMPLKNVLLRDCVSLLSLQGLEEAPLEELVLTRCRSIKDLLPLKDCKTLQVLDLSGCAALTTLEGLDGLPIKKLYIQGLKLVSAAGIESLPLEEIHGVASLSKEDRQRLDKITTLKKVVE